MRFAATLFALLLLATVQGQPGSTTASDLPAATLTNLRVSNSTSDGATFDWDVANACSPDVTGGIWFMQEGSSFLYETPHRGNGHHTAIVTGLPPANAFRAYATMGDDCATTPGRSNEVSFETLASTWTSTMTSSSSDQTITHIDPHMGFADGFVAAPRRTGVTFLWDWTPGCARDAEVRVYEDADGQVGELVASREVDAAEQGPHEAEVDGLEPGTDYWGHVLVTHHCGIAGGGSEYVRFRTRDARFGDGLAATLAVVALLGAVALRRRL